MSGPRLDYDRAAADYGKSRALPLDAIASWRDAIARHLPSRPGLRVADVGSGAGTFANAFADWFGARVVAVEPSAGMRREAVRKGLLAGIAQVGAAGEALPLASASCDAAWLSTVIHHLRDREACAHEIRRVLRPGAPVLIRSSFPGRHDRITVFRYFPGASRVASEFPTVEAICAEFARAGFRFEALEGVPQVSAPDLATALAQARLRADSTLAPLPDEEFDAGIAALERDVAAGTSPGPVVDHIDLLVLR